MTEKLITRELLIEWNACAQGIQRFCELFPDGADLKTAIEVLVNDGHNDWGVWLFKKCREHKLYVDFVVKGYRNSGDYNSGDYNSGYGNSGNRNSGNYNSGDCNSGNYNSGDYNSGYFNSETPEDILVFNKPVSRDVWNNTKKPQFISNVKLCFWVDASEMTDAEKIADPDFYVRGGCLRNRDYKEVWKIAWDNRQQDDERILRQLPNFDAKVFEKITGIKLGE